MFLHSGASLHGHEYSNRPAPAAHQNTNKRSPLLRSAFAAPKPRPISLDGAVRPPAIQFRRPLSECLPSLPEAVVRFLEPVEKETLQTPMTEDVVSIMSSPEFSDTSLSEATTAVATSSAAEGASVPATSSPTRRKRRASSRASRKTTRYALAYPPPKRGHNVRLVQRIAPRLLLQLQVVSADKRPKPAIDAFPSSWLAGPLIAPRLAKRFPALFGPKRELSSADVILVESEDYGSDDVDSGDEEKRLEDKEPLAVLSPVKKSGHTEIALEGGFVWVAQPPSAKGNFDFIHTDAQGNTTTARWVRRSASKSTSKQAPAAESSKAAQNTPEPPDARYTFSIINPASRRHPIMATLTPSFLDIQDSYTSVSTSSSRYPPSRPLSRSLTVVSQQHSQASSSTDTSTSSRPSLNRSVSSSAAEQGPASRTVQTPEPDTERTSHPVDDCTRLLISVTAVFIALESGWSPYYKSPHAHHAPDHSALVDSTSALTAVADACKSAARGRRKSSDDHKPDTLSSPLSLKRGVSLPQAGPSRTAAAVPSIAAPTVPPAWWESAPSPSGGGGPSTLPTSTGAAFMQRTRMASVQHQHAAAESSDSENPSSSRRRSRILSGGNGGKRDKGKGKAVDRPTTTVTPSAATAPAPDIAPAQDRADVTNGNNAAVPNVKDRERKTQSASHPVPQPVVTAQAEDGIELVAVGPAAQVVPANGQHLPPANGQHLPPANGHHLPPANGMVAGGRATGFTGRIKRLGHWFRRLGHGHGHPH